MEAKAKATRNTDDGMVYDWPAIEAAAVDHGVDPEVLKDWVWEGVTDEATAEQLVQAYLDEQAALDEVDAYLASLDPGPICPQCGWNDAEHRGPSTWHCSECDHEWPV